MEIQLGKHVISSDGKQIGTVDRLVLDADHRDLVEIIVHKGVLLTRDRIIELGFIKHVDSDGTVHLNLTSDKVDDLPLFIREEYLTPNPAEPEQDPYLMGVGTEGVLWRSPDRSAHYGWYGQDRSILEPSSFTPSEVEVRTNLPSGTIVVDEGAEVVAADGKVIGHVSELTVDEEGNLKSLRVHMGHLVRHHDADIPSGMIESMTHRRVKLTIPSVEIEHQTIPARPDGELVVDIERRVVSGEGLTVGEIDRLIVNPKTMEILDFVIGEGFILRDEKLLDPEMIKQTFKDGTIELAISADEAHSLPPFVRDRYYVPSPERFHAFSSEGWAGSTIVDPEVIGPIYTGDQAHLIQAGDVPPDAVILTEKTAIYGNVGHKIGTIDQVAYTPDHVLTALILRAGRVFHHEVRIPVEWIDSMRHDRIGLRVSKEECERRTAPKVGRVKDLKGLKWEQDNVTGRLLSSWDHWNQPPRRH